MTNEETIIILQKSLDILESVLDFSHEYAEIPLRSLAEELNIKPGEVFGILRVAVTGQTVSPPLLESMSVIGREKVFERIRNAIDLLRNL